MRARLAFLLAGLWLAASFPGIAGAAQVPAPDPAQGDGGVPPFYTWTDDIPALPGRMLRIEPLDLARGLSAAAEQFRILYTSTDGIDGKTPVVVSGAYFAPKGNPPAGGWPLVAWAHGTTGIADTCAPSWNPRSERDFGLPQRLARARRRHRRNRLPGSRHTRPASLSRGTT